MTAEVKMAEAEIERLGLTALVESWEENELGQVYLLTNEATIVITQDTTQVVFDAGQWTEAQADSFIQYWHLDVKNYEMSDEGLVYTLTR